MISDFNPLKIRMFLIIQHGRKFFCKVEIVFQVENQAYLLSYKGIYVPGARNAGG